MARNFLRPREIQDTQNDRNAIKESLSGRYKKLDAENAGHLRAAVKSLDKRLEQTAPELNADQRDRAAKELAKIEGELRVGMLSAEEMRRCPPGAVERNRAWERRNKAKVLRMKNLILALNPNASQEFISAKCNIARLRPRTSQLNMEGSVIPQEKTFVRGFGDAIDWDADTTQPSEPMWPELQEQPKPAVPTAEQLLEADEEETTEFSRSLDESFGADAQE